MSLINQVLDRLEHRGVQNQILGQLERRGAPSLVWDRPERRVSHSSFSETLVYAEPLHANSYWDWLKPVLWGLLILVTFIALVVYIRDIRAQAAEAENYEAALALVGEPVSKMSMELSEFPPAKSPRDNIATRNSKTVDEVFVPVMSSSSVTSNANAEQPLKLVSEAQRSDAEYRKAQLLQQQGREADALAGYGVALQLNPQNESARLASAALLIQIKRGDDAVKLLQEGLAIMPSHLGFSMNLARIQLELGAIEQAVATLNKNLDGAKANGEYQAFLAALLQRQGAHQKAVEHYAAALKIHPGNGAWWMGYGLSLQALLRRDEAKVAYERSIASRTLNAELTAYVEQKIKTL
ncbi:MAG: tetratricopeptide repeat protein [Sideroxydans sp.]|nr:tetratricopeptide repeat protein [Sideroxydans sp.]